MKIDDNIELPGASIDALHALFFRGPLVAGDLPSKSGASDLVGLGLATTSEIASRSGDDSLFTYLTPPGQAYAIKFLVEADFGCERNPRSLASAMNVKAHGILWGVDVKWDWPTGAGQNWYASIRADYDNGDDVISQGKRVIYPNCAYLLTGLPAGKEVSLTLTLHDGNGKRSNPTELNVKTIDNADAIMRGLFSIRDGEVFVQKATIGGVINHCYRMNIGVNNDKGSTADEHSPVTLADCIKRFADTEPMPFGGFPMPKRKIRINISGLHDLKNGIVTGAEVKVGIWQQNKLIHYEVFSGKATQPFSRDVEVHASFGEILVTHNRPDLKELKVSAEFNDAKDSIENVNSLANIINKHIRERLKKELQPGGLLYRR